MFSPTFTFDSPRSPSLDSSSTSTRDTSRSVSPCSPTSPYPPPRYSVTDLAASLDKQRIRPDAQICYQPCDSYANPDDDAAWALPPLTSSDDEATATISRVRSSTSMRSFSPSRRMQRQTNSRLLCSATHHKDIAALLSQMVNSSEQCSVSPAENLARSNDDEGYDSAEEEQEQRCASRRSSVATIKRGVDYRRASDFRKTSSAVISKDVRFRNREKVHRRQRSGEKSD